MRQHVDVPVPMRDGVCLSTDIRYPDSGGPFPTLVTRTPYSNNDPPGQLRYVRMGYAVVAQDCRGRFDSAGRFEPFREAEDGFDALAWVLKQPWCNGSIGMFGESYRANAQLSAAWLKPPGLKTITPRVMGRDAFKDLIYYNGVPNMGIMAAWGFGMTGRAGQDINCVDWTRLFRHLPMMTMGDEAGYLPHFFKEWLLHPTYDKYWSDISVEAHWADYDIPALHIGGWYDVFADGILRNFQGMRRYGGPLARAHQRIVMGPWAHALNTRSLAQCDFGTQAVIDLDGLETRWLARWVKGEQNGIENEPPVRIFIMGTNVWRDEQDWPPARAQDRDYYLASGGRANSMFGDGALATAAPSDGNAAVDSYVYNPDNPTPASGGGMLHPAAGPQDQAPIERRDDVLVYTGPEVREPMEVTGFIKAVLHVSTDVPDTDFVARLCDMYPDGRSIILCDGITRARFREGLDREVMMTPGKVYELTVEMGATANTFLPGHRVRLEVTSSCYPRFARNLNTGEPIATGTRMQIARQTIHHSRVHPSRLILPIVPNA